MTPLPLGRPRFVTLDEALAWHEVSIVQYGGSFGARDTGLLESALAQPRQQFGSEFAHQYPFGMAAAYAYYIAKNHPFVDGNKRVALMCCGGFLRMNGWNLVSEGEAAADAILDLVAGALSREGYAQWLQDNCRPRPSMELRDFFSAVQLHSIQEQYEAVLAGTRSGAPTELMATHLEGADAIPLCMDYLRAARDCLDAGDHEGFAEFCRLFSFLAALYRIAEDMGYEW